MYNHAGAGAQRLPGGAGIASMYILYIYCMAVFCEEATGPRANGLI